MVSRSSTDFQRSLESEVSYLSANSEDSTTMVEVQGMVVKEDVYVEGDGYCIEKHIERLTVSIEEISEQRRSASPSGHLGNLTFEQQKLLISLWGMLIEYLKRPFDEKAAKKKDRQLVSMMYEWSIETASSTTSLAESERSQISVDRSSAMQDNPLNEEFWSQAGAGDLDTLLLRFLRARKWNLNDAFQMVIDTLEWRRMYEVRKIMAEGEAGIKRELLASGKSYFWNVDREGRLLSIITSRLHDRYAQTLVETCRFTVYLMELGRRLMTPAETVTIIFDMADAPLASFDLGSIQFMIQCFQSFYPESLGKCLVLNPTWLFSGFYKAVKGFLDPVVQAKIELISDPEEIKKFVPEENLLEQFGGTCKYRYEFVESSEAEEKGIERADRIAPLTDEQVERLEAELSDLQTRLIDTTIALNGLYAADEGSLTAADPTLLALADLRETLKRDITARRALLDANSLPKNMYHRIGVLAPDWKVSWPKVV